MKKMFGMIMSSSLLWGGLISIGFYAAIRRGMITNELVVRYTAGHFVEYVTVSMFFIGMAALLFKWFSVRREKRALAFGTIFPVVHEKEPVSNADEYLRILDKTRLVRGDSCHIRRLKAALTSLKLNGNVEDLDQELRFLADDDQFRATADYGMVRMFIWAIPILGFLGTVIGITMALGNLNLTELETTGKLLAEGLQVAFDTTALALTLVFFLYFSLFFIQGQESAMFQALDRMVDCEIRGRFLSDATKEENEQLGFVRKSLDSIAESFDTLLKRQTALWTAAMTKADERSAALAVEGARQIENALAVTLRKEQEHFAEHTIQPLTETIDRKMEKLGLFKEQMIEESKIMLEVLRATGEVTRLEDRLNHNLATLAKAGSFEETVNTLAATIHLLNSKLTSVTPWTEIRLAASPEQPVSGTGRKEKDARVIPLPDKINDSDDK